MAASTLGWASTAGRVSTLGGACTAGSASTLGWASAKDNWKTLSGLELASIPGASLFLIPLGPPVKVWTTPVRGQRAVSTADLIQSEYDQKHLSLSNCWTLDHWMSGGPVEGVSPLARLANLPRPQTWSRLRSLYLGHLHCPTRVPKFGPGTWTCASYVRSWLILHWAIGKPRLESAYS